VQSLETNLNLGSSLRVLTDLQFPVTTSDR